MPDNLTPQQAADHILDLNDRWLNSQAGTDDHTDVALWNACLRYGVLLAETVKQSTTDQ